MENALILLVCLLVAGLLVMPRLANSVLWRATTTPLASIIGSGFLVLGPILDASYGRFAPLVMAALCGGAFLFGHTIRFNIAVIAGDGVGRSKIETQLESLASWALAFAYIISVAYYLNLFGSFGVSLTALNDDTHARLLTSAVFVLILIVGWTRGFSAMERMEQLSVGIKLAIIAGLLVGLLWFFVDKANKGVLMVNPATKTGWAAITLAFGLIVTVQGFETSRYLGKTYGTATRIRSMRLAQYVSTGIYLTYISLLAYVFAPGEMALDETAIIDLMQIVAPILPVLLVAAALSAQFSAAVADTSGSGGLIAELTKARVTERQGYLVLVVFGLAMTWAANVFQIISYASRAFALYYALQALIATVAASRRLQDRWRVLPYAGLAILGVMIMIFGATVE